MSFTRISSQTEYQFPAGTSDLRGYDVRTGADDEKAGKVSDILLDDTGAPRYLDLDLGFMKKKVLVPVGHAMADPDEEVVVLPGMTRDDLERVPDAVEAAAIDRDYERRVTTAYSAPLTGDRAYARPEYGGAAFAARAGGESGTLARVDQLDEIDVADYETDPRGWDVVTADTEPVGTVRNLIGDTAAMRVRYLNVALDVSVDPERRKVLVPVGFASLNADERTVRLNWVESSMIRSLPAYEGSISRDYTERLHEALDREPDERWYEHPRYSAGRLYRSDRARG